ncbi:MAG: DUF5011 domain-containing protein, partial [Oscillospiraceae bacterium]|nr:DUF5011 domain-containing protein [Oscillospiraceae bacterium]
TNTTIGAITTQNTTNTTIGAITTQNTTNTTIGATTTQNITNTTFGATTTQNTTNITVKAATTSNTTNTTREASTTSNTTNTTRGTTTTSNTTNTTKGATTTSNTTNSTRVASTTSNTTNTTREASTTSNTTNTTKVTSTTSNTTKEIINTTWLSNTTSGVNTTVNTTPTLLVREQVTINQGESIDLRSLIVEAKGADGTDLKNDVIISGEVDTSEVGAYPISYSVTDKNGMTKAAKSIVSVSGKETVIIGDNAIDAHDFSLSVSEAKTITEEQILAKAGVDAWNIPSGEDLTDVVQIDKTELKGSVGQYKISMNINLLKATIGKNSRGEDSAIVIATVYEGYASSPNNILPTTGENEWVIKFLSNLRKYTIQIN